jgi:hypothetical protein
MAAQIEAGPEAASAPPFDRTAVKVNQMAIVTMLLAAFIFNQPWLVPALALIMALGTLTPQLALFQRFYRDVLRPAGLLRADIHAEDAAPHRFAQGFGAGVLLVASLVLFAGIGSLGWGLVLLVATLAAVNLLFGFCAGCFLYLQLAKLRRPS